MNVQPTQNSGNHVISESQAIREDFSRLVRRIMYSNSGQFSALGRAQQEPLGSRDWNKYKELAEAAIERGNYSQAEAMWLGALNEAKEFPLSDERLMFTLESLANLYYTLGRVEQAESFFWRIVDIATRALGPFHVRLAQALNSLAGIYYSQKRFAEAEPICQRVLSIYERIYGFEHADVGMVANNLAMLHHAQGNKEAAEKYYLQAIRIRTHVLGSDHVDVVTAVVNYGNLLRSCNRFAEADALVSWTNDPQKSHQPLSAAV